MTPEAWSDKSVFLTGHTGFKGGWLALWLHRLGAKIHGYALDPPAGPSFTDVASVASVIATDTRADLRDSKTLASALRAARPEVVFHLAAQPLVRESYRDPAGTFATNVMGTANLLEAVRSCDSVRAVVIITTDKVYHNREWVHPYRESDPLGGRDPYSASKAAAEMVAASYGSSFFNGGAKGHPARVATARAGNVIGGGDWAEDRLVPDCLRAFGRNEPVRLRFPGAVRPWQHVLEPLAGYLALAAKLLETADSSPARAWNFGPGPHGDATVGAVAEMTAAIWGTDARVISDLADDHPHEAGLLRLDSSAALHDLGWRVRWNLKKALEATVAWHREWMNGGDMGDFTMNQIDEYCETWES